MSAHVDVASYALGLLDQREEGAFEAHLAECDTCAMELESMVPTLYALDGIESPQVLESLGLPTQPAYGGERALREDAGWTGAAAGTVGASAEATDQHTWTDQDRWPQRAAWSEQEAWSEQDSWTDQEQWPQQQQEWPDTPQEWSEQETWAQQPAASTEQDRWPQQEEWTDQRGDVTAEAWPDAEQSGPIAPVEPIGRRGSSGRREPLRREPGRREPARLEPVRGQAAEAPERVTRLDSPDRRSGGHGGERVPTPRESGSRWRTPTMAAAAVISLGIITGGGYLAFQDRFQDQSTGRNNPAIAQEGQKVILTASAQDPSTGVTADVEGFAEPYGTRMSFTVTDIQGPLTCRLLAVKADGSTEVLSTWKVPDTGYGTEANPRGLTLDVDTALEADDIDSLKVQAIEDEVVSTLVTLRT